MAARMTVGGETGATGERQFATALDGGRGIARGSGCLSYERPAVSQNRLSAASCQDKTISVAGC